MRKRARLCDHRPMGEYNVDDFISRLPEEILVSIVSRLTLKEAVATGILSRQWGDLWKSVTTLNFQSDAALGAVLDSRSRNTERAKFINWVNRVIRHHKGSGLDTFRIFFDLDKTSRTAIDNWIKFAVTNNVKRLELDLLQFENGIAFFRRYIRSYSFPFKFFSGRRSNMATFTGLRYLRVLSLRCVNVSDQVMESLLLNCSLLESLSVHASNDLVNVKVSGQSLKLNFLMIAFCITLKTVEIRNTSLASFRYFGGRGVSFSFKNFPKLIEVSMGVNNTGVAGQLGYCLYHNQEKIEFSNVPELGELKEIILKIEPGMMEVFFSSITSRSVTR